MSKIKEAEHKHKGHETAEDIDNLISLLMCIRDDSELTDLFVRMLIDNLSDYENFDYGRKRCSVFAEVFDAAYEAREYERR